MVKPGNHPTSSPMAAQSWTIMDVCKLSHGRMLFQRNEDNFFLGVRNQTLIKKYERIHKGAKTSPTKNNQSQERPPI